MAYGQRLLVANNLPSGPGYSQAPYFGIVTPWHPQHPLSRLSGWLSRTAFTGHKRVLSAAYCSMVGRGVCVCGGGLCRRGSLPLPPPPPSLPPHLAHRMPSGQAPLDLQVGVAGRQVCAQGRVLIPFLAGMCGRRKLPALELWDHCRFLAAPLAAHTLPLALEFNY